jgi:hypothetical protein
MSGLPENKIKAAWKATWNTVNARTYMILLASFNKSACACHDARFNEALIDPDNTSSLLNADV